MPSIKNYRGIIPAISCPFTSDHRIDEPALRKLASWLATHDGVVAVMTNGHTGEVFSLTPSERAEVTRIVADELKGKMPVISSIVCEGLADAAEHARAAKAAGAVALDVMPPHHWLRFGFTPKHALEYFEAIHKAAPDLDLVCHVYPAWTRASYSSQLLADLARLPYVQAFKVGQRDMNKYARDIQAIREADASKSILTCHDEYLLASMVQGVDGALVGFATFIPQLIIDLWNAVKAGNLNKAIAIQAIITPLKDAVYGGGEPTGEAHARMKGGMYLAGVLEAPTVRPPTEAPNAKEMDALRAAVKQAGLLKR
jgi:4-hydroxy-tetrahydrodipicolinate synthase